MLDKKKIKPQKITKSNSAINQLNKDMRQIEKGNYSFNSMIASNYFQNSSLSENNDSVEQKRRPRGAPESSKLL